MKILLPVLMTCCVLVVFVSAGFAQGVKVSVHKVGKREVRIPAPEGFFDVAGRFDRITGRFADTGGMAFITLAVHVPDELLPVLEAGQEPELGFYSRAYVPATGHTDDIPVEMFRAAAAEREKLNPAVFDPDGAGFREALADARKALARQHVAGKPLAIRAVKRLGYFYKGQRVFSEMVFEQKLGEARPKICSNSIVHANLQMINAVVCRDLSSEVDAVIVRDLTEEWTAAIAAANVPPPPPMKKRTVRR